MKLAGAVLMDIGTIRKVFVCNGNVKIVTTKDGNANVQRHLIDLHSLADAVYVQQEETIVKQRI